MSFTKTYTDKHTGEKISFVQEAPASPSCTIEDEYRIFIYELYEKVGRFYFSGWSDFENADIELVFYLNDKLDKLFTDLNRAMPKGRAPAKGPQVPIINYDHLVLMVTLSQLFSGDGKKKR